jgi:outer membrane protein assembly factor BamB
MHGDRLYTAYRPPVEAPNSWASEEIVTALDEASGRTLWEYRYPARPLNFRFGAGPYATPLLVEGRLFALGTNNQLMALDAESGRPLWSHDLVAEYGAQEVLVRPAVKAGMSCSPIAHGNLVIVTAGGRPGQSVMAFDQRTGAVAWRSGDFDLSQSSPILIDVLGETHLVVFGGRNVNGLDPTNGRLLWSHPHDTDGDMNISTPVWTADRLLFLSSGYNGGARLLQLNRTADGIRPAERWFSSQLRIHLGNALRSGSFVVGSSGDFGPAFLTALDLETGRRLWQDRSFSRAQLVAAGDKILVLDEDGTLGLTRASETGLEVLAKAPVLTNLAWTPPTLVGSSLYVRDRRSITKFALP